ncbi:hypothetical protein PLICRDRAFT_159795 [Plicaturopsis crispa FD-325 SS-3]|nr:hypothetical protein PLICRDRAFT_159795 [Plicaturopsis crispa FD-325 SS-3]
MATSASLQDLVEEWLRLDKNEHTRNEIEGLWKQGNNEELERRLRKRIEFGTAGLRGRMEAGFSRMNDLIIIQASQGLCAYVLQTIENAASRGVVIGHDHRHNSERWAQLTATAFIARGVKVYLHRGLVHTPLVPFSVKRLNAACGVMITASHNPKQDNGYKVYWENAVQIIGPHDTGIAAAITENLQPGATAWDPQNVFSDPLCVDRTQSMRALYLENVSSMSLSREANAQTKIKFVNTSMHGVGHPFVVDAMALYGFPKESLVEVESQRDPDPEFPTVKFPNPEEHGEYDLALRTAEQVSAHYVLAQDPDADRFSAAEHGPQLNGEWTTFTGDQLGTLFASQAIDAYKASGKPMSKLAIVASTVSSKMIEAMADAEGFKFVECLTGFKFIGNTALSLVAQGYEVPFGYEEAIGFMFGSEIRDKDGVAATVVFSELANSLQKQGKTLKGHLQELYQKYGYFQTSNSYFICSDPPTIDAIFARIRNFDGSATGDSPSYPKSIAGLNVTRVVDLTTGYDSANPPSYEPSLPLSSGHMIQLRAQAADGNTKIVLTTRTSGTEPKIKYYLEGSGKDAKAVGALLPKVVDELGSGWMEAEKHGLGRP